MIKTYATMTYNKIAGSVIMMATALALRIANLFTSPAPDLLSLPPADTHQCSISQPISIEGSLPSISIQLRNASEATKTRSCDVQIENRYPKTTLDLELIKMANIEACDIDDNLECLTEDRIPVSVKNSLDISPFRIILSNITNMLGNIQIFTIPVDVLISFAKIDVFINGRGTQQYFSINSGDEMKIQVSNTLWSYYG